MIWRGQWLYQSWANGVEPVCAYNMASRRLRASLAAANGTKRLHHIPSWLYYPVVREMRDIGRSMYMTMVPRVPVAMT